MKPIVIVGGGIIGSGLAYQLRDAERPVYLLEKNALGSGTTAASIAMFSWLQTDPSAFEHRLRERAWETYEPLVERGEISFERIGGVLCAETEQKFRQLEASAETLRSFGVDVEVRSPDELEALGIDDPALVGGIYSPRVGYLDPTEIIRYWTDRASESDVEIETGVEVTDVRTRDGAVTGVETSDGVFDAAAVINAAGPWSPSVAEMTGLSLPIRHTYGRILVLRSEEELSLPYVVFEDGSYFREEGVNQAFAGRLEKAYEAATRYDPDAAHAIDDEFRTDVANRTRRSVPALADADVANEWVGLRAVSPDGNPILGPTAVDGFCHATGMSGLGVTLAPAVTAALADYVRSGANETVDRLTVDRFR